MGDIVLVAVRLGPRDVVAVTPIHLDAADLRHTVEPECHQKFVQQAGVVIVTGILGIELPVSLDALSGVAKHLDLSTAQAVHLLDDRLAKIGLERFSVGGIVPNSTPETFPTARGCSPCADISKLGSRPPLPRTPRRNGIDFSVPSSP